MRVLGVRIVKPGERLHRPLVNMMMLQAAMISAAEAHLGATPKGPRKEGDQIVVLSRVADMQFGFPAYGPLERALEGRPSEAFGLSFCPGVPPASSISNIADFPLYLDEMIAAIFVLYFESCSDWLISNRHGDKSTWPEAVHFGRYVRNAVAHGGKLEIQATKSGTPPRTATWKGLCYSLSDHGRQILSTDLHGPDLVALMFDIHDDLVELGAPN